MSSSLQNTEVFLIDLLDRARLGGGGFISSPPELPNPISIQFQYFAAHPMTPSTMRPVSPASMRYRTIFVSTLSAMLLLSFSDAFLASPLSGRSIRHDTSALPAKPQRLADNVEGALYVNDRVRGCVVSVPLPLHMMIVGRLHLLSLSLTQCMKSTVHQLCRLQQLCSPEFCPCRR